MIRIFRKLLITTGKAIPFVLCFIVLINYIECGLCLIREDYVLYGEHILLNTKVSFIVGDFFEYDFVAIAIVIIISVAVETCTYNKLACVYLCVNLLEKNLFTFSMDEVWVETVCVCNIIPIMILLYKGFRKLTKQ